MDKEAEILTTLENGILKVIFNRPKKYNAITRSMYKQLGNIFNEAAENKDVYMIVLTGKGKFFSSGNDLLSYATMENIDTSDMQAASLDYKIFVDILIKHPKLLVAVVNGPAIGIAATILPLFDMVYASDTVYFQTPFTSLGLVAEGCSTYTFPRIMGYSKAGDMLYLGYKMSAHEAKQVGLVSKVYEHNCLDEVWTYLHGVSTLSMEAIFQIKRHVRKWNQNFLLELNNAEAEAILSRLEAPDTLERSMKFQMRKNKL